MRTSAGRCLLMLALSLHSGCAITIGSRLVEGALTEAAGKGKSKGAEGVVESIVERQLLAELGHQIGEGLRDGAVDITPEQRKSLEDAVGGVLTVALTQAGKGIRNEVSPELRAMVQRDIVDALSEGVRGKLGDSLEETVDRVVSRAVFALNRNLQDADLQIAVSDMLRESVYLAVREGRGYTPGIGETIESTLTESIINPTESSVDTLTAMVASKVDESAKRTERTLKGIIQALVLIIGGLVVAYFVSRRQLLRQTQQATVAQAGLRGVDAALGMLDEATRAEVKGKLDEYQQIATEQLKQAGGSVTSPPAPERSDDYVRRK